MIKGYNEITKKAGLDLPINIKKDVQKKKKDSKYKDDKNVGIYFFGTLSNDAIKNNVITDYNYLHGQDSNLYINFIDKFIPDIDWKTFNQSFLEKGVYEYGDVIKFKEKNRYIYCKFWFKEGSRKLGIRVLSLSDVKCFIILKTCEILNKTKWPNINNSNYNKEIKNVYNGLGFQAEEISVDKKFCDQLLPSSDRKPKIILNNYQKIASTYLIFSKIRGILVWHGLGTGKTCTAIDSIEYTFFKKHAKKFIQDMHSNENIKKFNLINLYNLGDASKRIKDKDGNFIYNVYIVLPPQPALMSNFKKEIGRCPSFIRGAIELSKFRKDGSPAKGDRSTFAIQNYIGFLTYVKLSKRLKKNPNFANNCLLIFDEVHRLLNAEAEQFRQNYIHLRKTLREIKNPKLLFLTATPIINEESDFSRIINMLKQANEPNLPLNNAEFYKKYFNGKEINGKIFSNDIKGVISYFKGGDVTFFAPKDYQPYQIVKATQEHYEDWKRSYEKEMNKYKSTPGEDLINIKDRYFLSAKGYLNRSSQKANYPPHRLRDHGNWTNKFRALDKNLNKFRNEKHFVISRHNSRGANPIGFYLESKKWIRMSSNRSDHSDSWKPTSEYYKFVNKAYSLYLRGQKLKSISEKDFQIQKEKLFSTFKKEWEFNSFIVLNSKSTQNDINKLLEWFFNLDQDFDEKYHNIYGKYCNVLVADFKYTEGVSLFNTTNIHIFDPFYSNPMQEQAYARPIRFCSHKFLDFDKRKVKIWKYFIIGPNKEPMTDDLLEKFQNEKMTFLYQIIAESMKNSVDFGLYYKDKTKMGKKFYGKLIKYDIKSSKKGNFPWLPKNESVVATLGDFEPDERNYKKMLYDFVNPKTKKGGYKKKEEYDSDEEKYIEKAKRKEVKNLMKMVNKRKKRLEKIKKDDLEFLNLFHNEINKKEKRRKSALKRKKRKSKEKEN